MWKLHFRSRTRIKVGLAAAQVPDDLCPTLREAVGPAVVGVELELVLVVEVALSLV